MAEVAIVEKPSCVVEGESSLQNDDTEYGEPCDYTDPNILSAALREVDGHFAAINGILKDFKCGFSSPNAVDLRLALENIQKEENLLFSDFPIYVQREIQKDKEKNAAFNSTVPSQIKFSDERPISDNPTNYRAYVSPQVPLSLPFDYKRFLQENPDWRAKEGTYHDLFFGDGSNCCFPPPEDNKRAQIEERNMNKPIASSKCPPPVYDPPPRAALKVDSSFVPSCARVDHSEAQEKLRLKKAQQRERR